MNNSETRAWQAVYGSAALESDPDKALNRVTEAQRAIEQSLLESPSPDAPEHQAIKAAWKMLVTLKSAPRPKIAPLASVQNHDAACPAHP